MLADKTFKDTDDVMLCVFSTLHQVAGRLLVSLPSRASELCVTLIAIAASHLFLRLPGLVGSLRSANVVHFLEATSPGAFGVRAGVGPAHQIAFARGSRALRTCTFLSLRRHIVLQLLDAPRQRRRFLAANAAAMATVTPPIIGPAQRPARLASVQTRPAVPATAIVLMA
jgi:hypothetical protein